MTVTIICPIDQLQVKAITTVDRGGDAQKRVGEHLHQTSDRTQGTCSNGHTWRIDPFDVNLTRTA